MISMTTRHVRRRLRLKACLHLRNIEDIGLVPIGVPWPRANGFFEGGGVCRGCGCTGFDCSGCIERTGEPCWWVEPDLCSACAFGAVPVEATA